MVATAHSDLCSVFMRKIGYSAGLERTLERVGDLQKLYTSSRDVTMASWRDLVTSASHWGLKSHDNITDVFFSLRLIQQTPGDLLVLENLDATALACSLLGSDEERERARSFLILWAILVNDGEIFVNLLLAGFEEVQIRRILTAMIEKKRTVLKQVLPGKHWLRRIYRVVTVERQEKNKGSAGSGMRSVASLKRTAPLQGAVLAMRNEVYQDRVEFSVDYFRKVPPRRKDWARSLDLWHDGQGLTQKGKNFIGNLRQAGYINCGFFVFWPMDYELVRAGFRHDLLGPPKRLWECLVELGRAYSNIKVRTPSKSDPDEAVVLIEAMMSEFRSLHARKSMLRRELPITVAYPAAMAVAVARNVEVMDLPSALHSEQKGEQRRIAFRQSRHTGGALSLKR